MSGNTGEAVTDPRYIYGDDMNVVAYRLGIVETDLKSMDLKLDKIINEYPTLNYLALLLDPLKEKIKELEDKREAEQESKIKHDQQMKYMTYAAVIGPLGTFVITLIMGALFGVIPNGQ